jgi:hypothetical protein
MKIDEIDAEREKLRQLTKSLGDFFEKVRRETLFYYTKVNGFDPKNTGALCTHNNEWLYEEVLIAAKDGDRKINISEEWCVQMAIRHLVDFDALAQEMFPKEVLDKYLQKVGVIQWDSSSESGKTYKEADQEYEARSAKEFFRCLQEY